MLKQSVVGVAEEEIQAENAIRELLVDCFPDDEISVLVPVRSGAREEQSERLLSGAVGFLSYAGPLHLPGLGSFIAGGPWVRALRLGGAGLTEALVQTGIPEDEARHYEQQAREGRLLISVLAESPERKQLAKSIFERMQIEDISTFQCKAA